MVQTDAQGEFKLSPERDAQWLIAAGPEGFAISTVSQFNESKTLVLQPWGKIEGQLMEGDKPLAGQEVILREGPNGPGGLRLDINNYKSITDQNGRFQFDLAPACDLQISGMIPIASTGNLPGGFSAAAVGRSFTITNYARIQPTPGETTKVLINLPPAVRSFTR